jgi:pilus assembly protein Flp/PilA
MVGRTPGKTQRLVESFAGDERGATAVEYALIATFIFLAIVTSVGLIAPKLNATFSNVSGKLK